MIVTPPPDYDPARPCRDLSTGHELLRQRWAVLEALLAGRGYVMFVNEVGRYHVRQQWLYGAGRTEDACRRHGVPARFARPQDPVVTNAWSCATSAHGWSARQPDGTWRLASAALDVVPLGTDGKPWTKDDPWDGFLAAMKSDGYDLGLVHFHAPGKPPWDKPHLQLREWSDVSHSLVLP